MCQKEDIGKLPKLNSTERNLLLKIECASFRGFRLANNFLLRTEFAKKKSPQAFRQTGGNSRVLICEKRTGNIAKRRLFVNPYGQKFKQNFAIFLGENDLNSEKKEFTNPLWTELSTFSNVFKVRELANNFLDIHKEGGRGVGGGWVGSR